MNTNKTATDHQTMVRHCAYVLAGGSFDANLIDRIGADLTDVCSLHVIEPSQVDAVLSEQLGRTTTSMADDRCWAQANADRRRASVTSLVLDLTDHQRLLLDPRVLHVRVNGFNLEEFIARHWFRFSAAEIVVTSDHDSGSTIRFRAVVALPEFSTRSVVRRAIYSKVTAALAKFLRGVCSQLPVQDLIPSLSLESVSRYRSTIDAYRAKISGIVKRNIMFRNRPEWEVGFGRGDDDSGGADHLANLRRLEAPPGRFFADPIVVVHEGKPFVFVEDFSVDRKMGVISVISNLESAEHHTTQVLVKNHHLAYPFVMKHRDRHYMIPDTATNGTVELYRAQQFPFRWTLERILISDRKLSDCTTYWDSVSQHWYMFCTDHRSGIPPWDSLSLYYSPDLFGPWKAHPANPIKIDARSSRPAGPLSRVDGVLLRPTQDCTRGYGSGIVWCRVEELSPEKYSETPICSVRPPNGSVGVHTWSSDAGFVATDFRRF